MSTTSGTFQKITVYQVTGYPNTAKFGEMVFVLENTVRNIRIIKR
jgi:hypothetical protein